MLLHLRHVVRHGSTPPLFLGDLLAARQALSQLGPGCVSVLQDPQCRVMKPMKPAQLGSIWLRDLLPGMRGER